MNHGTYERVALARGGVLWHGVILEGVFEQVTYFLKNLFIIYCEKEAGREEGRERDREIPTGCFTHLCICWLIVVCALTGDQTITLAYRDDAPTD